MSLLLTSSEQLHRGDKGENHNPHPYSLRPYNALRTGGVKSFRTRLVASPALPRRTHGSVRCNAKTVVRAYGTYGR